MPMPMPKNDESESDYVSRFMGDKAMLKEYPDRKQRVAVAYSEHAQMKKRMTKKFMDERKSKSK